MKLYKQEGLYQREAIEVNCNYCNKVILKSKHLLKGQTKFYCDCKCRASSRKVRIKVICTYCKQKFEITPSDKKKSRSGLFFCSRQCKDNAQKIDFGLIQIQPNHYNKGESEYRNRALEKYGKKCSHCKYDEFEEGLDVHHIDEDRNNGNIDNLLVLCARCHVLVTRNVLKVVDRILVKN